MAKKGMKRPESDSNSKNEVTPVPEIQGKAKHGNVRANPIIEDNDRHVLKVYHTKEKKISSAYPVIDTDLARDNIENDLSAADLQDL